MMERERSLQQMMERLLGKQTEEMSAEAKAIRTRLMLRQRVVRKGIKCPMEAFAEGLRSCGKRMAVYHVSSLAYLEKSKAVPEVMEPEVVIFEKRSDKMEARDLEANSEAVGAVVERQELRRRLVVRRCRSTKKRIEDSVGSWPRRPCTT
jgi:hypothetical protein